MTEQTPTPAPALSPERQARVAQALKLFSIAAWVTGVWLLILCARMLLEYGFNVEMPSWKNIIGQLHGIFYMIYLVATLNLGTKARWAPTRWVTTALAGTIPFLSFVVEHRRRIEVKQAFQLS